MRPLAALNPRCYDRLRSRLQLSIREGRPIIQPFAEKLQAVCFDLDWTLSYYPLSTQQALEQALSRASCPLDCLGDLTTAADRYNTRWLELERTAESIDTIRLQIMTTLFEDQGFSDASTILKVSQAYDDIRRESGVLAYPGIDGFLADLRSTYRLGLFTNGPTFLQWDKLKALGFDTLFDAIIVAGDVGVYKPDPQAFRLLLNELDVPAKHSLFVGDNYDADIVGAHNAGMYTAWIKHDEDRVIPTIQPTIVTSQTTRLREVLL